MKTRAGGQAMALVCGGGIGRRYKKQTALNGKH